SVTVHAVIAITTGDPPGWSESATGAMYVVANAALGLLGTVLLIVQPDMIWLAAVLALAMFGAYRISERQRERHLRVLGLHGATSRVQDQLSGRAVTERLLEHARSMFGAESAEVLVLPHGGVPASRTWISPDGTPHHEEVVQLDATDGVWARVMSDGQGVR